MRSRISRALLGAAVSVAAWLCPSALHAQTAVLSSPPESSEIRELRVAYASSADHASLWLSLKLYGGADDVFLVVPAPAGAKIDLSSDAWFEALAVATHPRVVAPSTPSSCGQSPSPGTVELIGIDSHAETLAPLSNAEVHSFAEIVVWAGTKGLVLTTNQLGRLADLEIQGNRFVVLQFQPPAGESLTKTIRVSPVTELSAVPLLLTSAGGTRVPTTIWNFTAGRAWPATLQSLTVDPTKIQWSVSEQTKSNYTAVWNALLGNAQGHAWITEVAAHDVLFRATPIAGGAGAVPAVGSTYYERASGYGDAQPSYQSCVARFASLEASLQRVASACGRGDLISLQAEQPCSEEVLPGETSPEDLRCGKLADDLALALSKSIPSDVWLTRWSGYIPVWTIRDSESLVVKPGPALSPVVQCTAYDSTCEGDAGTGGAGGNTPSDPGKGGSGTGGGNTIPGQGGSGGTSGLPPSGFGGYGGHTGSQPSDPYVPEDDYDHDCYDCGGGTLVVDTGGSCSGDSSSSSGDSCSGDSSSSEGGDSCSGDSSSDEGGDSCSGDSSDEGGDSCSGDSSSSSGGESCDSSSSSGGGESCSGSGSSSSSDCSMVRRHGRRSPPLSGLTVGLVALLLPLRRRAKRRNA